MLVALLLGHIATSTMHVTKPGFNIMQLHESDIVSLSLAGRTAIFKDLPRGSFSVALSSADQDYLPVSVPDFSVSNLSIFLRCTARRSILRFWLLDESTCPDLNNVVIPRTGQALAIGATVTSPICLFPDVDGGGYEANIGTFLGIPNIAIFSALGSGTAVKRCIGESDDCAWKSQVPFFLTIQGGTTVNMTFLISRLTYRTTSCEIVPIPNLDRTGFVTMQPRITMTKPVCMLKGSALVQSLNGIMFVTALGLALSIAIRIALASKSKHWHCGAGLCARLRDEYQDCL